MASVHPSRLGLVPQDIPAHRDRDRDQDRERGYDSRRRDGRDEGRDRDRYKDRDEGGRGRGRTRSRSGERVVQGGDRGRENDEKSRRRSPDYSAYRRDEPPHVAAPIDASTSAPWRAQGNMYPPRGAGAGGGRGRQGFGAGGFGDDYFASRRKERESKQFSIWPKSPERPSRGVSPGRDSKRKHSSKRRRSLTPSSDDEREKRRKEKKKKRRDKDRDRDVDREKHRKKAVRDKSYDDDSEEDRRHRRRKSRSYKSDESSNDEKENRSQGKDKKEQAKSRHSSRAASPPKSHDGADEGDWVEKTPEAFVAIAEHTTVAAQADGPMKHSNGGAGLGQAAGVDSGPDSDMDDIGPQPAMSMTNASKRVDEREYGGALLRGEGSAMAAFLQGDTDARIPRRGEIGLTSEEIATFESVGYVMSGSRHRRMNAVRMRKENQVISAEEKRGILKLQREERERREAILRDEFRELVQEKLKGAGSGPAPQT